ncbi:hypothetical protein SAMN02799631_04775 [Methylobacterium sp. 174MFSha1.1]|uniref:hypothetical protein n=1 Tax=Methylobacterium sp. 174MFSha1.1 TaxID=1502749 RepID=UPI0008E2FCCF|nr:hypothetical protein [Methylobacterium sp. 174MFSha1.1]SFV08812.1 hypothetical protein SAMN02799631_04775 [Methylobacterium sp. 174MFSha1.1]
MLAPGPGGTGSAAYDEDRDGVAVQTYSEALSRFREPAAARRRTGRPAARGSRPLPAMMARQALARLAGRIVPEGEVSPAFDRRRLAPADPAVVRRPHRHPRDRHRVTPAPP